MDILCRIRDIQRSVLAFESLFERRYGVGLNEAMALCSLMQAAAMSSGEIGELLGLSPSNTSKVVASIERKGLVERSLGTRDKRQMYFSLTAEGRSLMDAIKCGEIEMPETLKSALGH